MRDASSGVENIRFSLGINGKCLSTFHGTLDCPTNLYRPDWHDGHRSISACSFLNKMHPFLQAWTELYCSPSRSSIFVASATLGGMEFGVGKIVVDNNLSNSFMQVFVALWVRQAFITSRVASSLETEDPLNRGVRNSSLKASSFTQCCRPHDSSDVLLPSMLPVSSRSSPSSLSLLLSSLESETLHPALRTSRPSAVQATNQECQHCATHPEDYHCFLGDVTEWANISLPPVNNMHAKFIHSFTLHSPACQKVSPFFWLHDSVSYVWQDT